MALLKFKKGEIANLAGIDKTEGNVYITEDSQEMYVDIDNNKRIKISDFITVANKNALQTVEIYDNAFYYVTEEQSIYKYVGLDEKDTTKRIWTGINNTDQITTLGANIANNANDISDLKNSTEELETWKDQLNTSTLNNAEDIIVTSNFGSLKQGDSLKDMSVSEILTKMLCVDGAPTITAPSMTVNPNGTTDYLEIGTSTSKAVTASISPGAYPYGYAVYKDTTTPDPTGSIEVGKDRDEAEGIVKNNGNGVTFTNFKIAYNGTTQVENTDGSKTTLEATISSGTATTTTEKKITATAAHTAGYNPVSLLGNKYPDCATKAGTLSKTPHTFRWYIPIYHGFKYAEGVEELAPIDLDKVQLTGSHITDLETGSFGPDPDNNNKVAANKITGSTAYSKTVPTKAIASGTWKQYFIAIPNEFNKTLKEVVDSNGLPVTFKSNKKDDKEELVSVNINGTNVDYKVYYISHQGTYDTTTIKLKW